MILTEILMGLKAFTGWFLSLAKKFWNKVLDFMQKGLKKLKTFVQHPIQGARAFIKKVGRVFQHITKYYNQDEKNEWYENTVISEINEEEVPEEIKQKNQEIDDEFETTEELKLAFGV